MNDRQALTAHLEDLAPRLIAELEAIAFGDGRVDGKIKAIELLWRLGREAPTAPEPSEPDKHHQEELERWAALDAAADAALLQKAEARRLDRSFEQP